MNEQRYCLAELMFELNAIVRRIEYDRHSNIIGYLLCDAVDIGAMNNRDKLVWNVGMATTLLTDRMIDLTEAYEIEKQDDLYTIKRIK
jgi:hypothetical protein